MRAACLALLPFFALGPAHAEDGRRTLAAAGCSGCHDIPGLAPRGGNVGPSLEGFGERVYIAGILPNTRENLIRWITQAQDVHPGDAMPSTPLAPAQADAVAAYLQKLR